MTRDEKLEAMAREWCKINGWQPDHRPIELEIERDADTNKMVGFCERKGDPIWTCHVKAMDWLLKAIGE